MKCTIPEVSLHNREPVLSVDFQYIDGNIRRMATAGSDTHVLIWYVTIGENGAVKLEIACDIRRHIKAVNVVRFSPNGTFLASGDDEAAIWLWNKLDSNPTDIFNEAEENENKEHWTGVRMLRGHIEDVYDLCWSPDGNFLISGSVDNTAIVWDIQKGRSTNIISDHKGFVQGVAWDPEDKYLATLSSDRVCRIYKVENPKRVHLRVDKANISLSGDKLATDSESPSRPVRLFHDDTLKTFCRRLTFTPDGEFLIAPSGLLQMENGININATYIFHRDSLNKPLVYLPTKDKYTLAVRCCPTLFTNRQGKENTPSTFNLPYRVVFAVATQDSVLFYDTQQATPFGMVSKIHYTRLSDLAWSKDGRILAISSTDGYCSFVTFEENELGTPYTEELPNYNKEKAELKKKKNKANKKDVNASSVPLKSEEEKSAIVSQVSPAVPKVQSGQTTATLTSNTSNVKKRVQLVTLFSPKLKTTIQVYKKKDSGESKKSADSGTPKIDLEYPEDTVLEVDNTKEKSETETIPDTFPNEEILKLDLSDDEHDIVLIPTDTNKDAVPSTKTLNSSDKLEQNVQMDEKMDVIISEEPMIVPGESGELLESVTKQLPKMQVNATEVTTPPRISSTENVSNVRTPTGTGVRTPRRVQLITLSSTKKTKTASENN